MNGKSTLRKVANDYLTHTKNEKGITLVALVVTIVVLLILSGIVIVALFSDNGIIAAAQSAKTEIEKAVSKKTSEIKELGQKAQEQIDKANGGANEGGKKEGNVLPKKEGITVPYLPTSIFKQLEGTNLENGLVISDRIENGVSTGNEYVWIEVPMNIYNNQIYNNGVNVSGANDYSGIENVLKRYVSIYREYGAEDVYDRSLTKGEGISENLKVFDDAADYNKLKNKMLESIYKNGGFWIGRYEAGAEIPRSKPGKDLDNLEPLSQANKYPLNNINRNQAQLLASKILENNNKYNSSLLFGLQWDLIMKYIEEKEVEKLGENNRTKIQNSLKLNSLDWGNYCGTSITITNTEASYSTDDGKNYNKGEYSKRLYDRTIFTTGASELFVRQNIYDLAGNMTELTLEFNSERDASVQRGGSYGSYKNQFASYRDFYGSSYCDQSYGFRVTIY